MCEAAENVLLERYAARAPDRHPGHVDAARAEDVREAVRARRWRALELEGERILLDTTDWSRVDASAAVNRAREWLSRPH